MPPAAARPLLPPFVSILLFAHCLPALASWDVYRIPQTVGTESIVDVNFISENDGWFLVGTSSDYELYRTSNAAETIVLASTGTYDLNEGDVDARSRLHFRNAQLGYLLPNDLFSEDLLRTENGGTTFEPMAAAFERVYVMHLLPGEEMWIAGTGGPSSATSVVAFSPNGGVTWEVPPTPLVFGFDATELYFFDGQHGWLAGAAGEMMYTHDGGQTWNISRTGTTLQINAIRFADPLHGWAAGVRGQILVTKDGGKNWIPQRSGTIENLYDLEVVDANRVFVVGGRIFSDNSLFRPSNVLFTRDGGANWFQENLPFTTALRGIQKQGNDLWIGGAGGRSKADMYLFHRDFEGHSSPVITLRPLPPGVRDFPYEDAPIEARFGTPPYTWSLSDGVGLAPPPGMDINPQTGALEGTPTASGTRRFGVVATDVNGATDAAEFAVNIASEPFSAGTDPLPAATHRKTYRAGIDFRGGNGPYDAQITSGKLPPGIVLESNLVLAGTPLEVGNFDFVLQVSDRSSPPQRATFNLSVNVGPLEEPEWEVQEAHNRIMDIHFFDDQEGIAVGWSGVILRTLDTGRTWNAAPFGQTMIDFTWIGDEGWMVTEEGLFNSTDRGHNWEPLSHPLAFLEGVHFLDSQTGWIFGDGIAYTANGGQTWDVANLPDPGVILALDFADPLVGFAGSNDGFVVKSIDGGMNWSPVVVQGLNDATKTLALAPPRPPLSPKGRPSTLEKGPAFAQVACVEFIDSQRGWLGTNQFEQPFTSLFRTENGGETWTRQQVRGRGNVESIQFLEDGLTGWTSMLFDTGVFYTNNGGTTWIPTDFEGGVGEVSFWSQHFLDATTGFVSYNVVGDEVDEGLGGFLQTGQEGSLWKTRDGGRSYELVYGFPDAVNRIPNNLAAPDRTVGPDLNSVRFFDDLNGFAVARATDGGTTSRLYLYRTRNGGATWQFLSRPGVDREILFATPLHGWAIDQNVSISILETRDGGHNFVPRTDIGLDGTPADPKSTLAKGIGQVEFSDIFFLDEQTGWIHINRKQSFSFTSRMLRTQDGGATWQKIYETSSGGRKSIYFRDRQNGYLFDEFGRIERSTDGGETWIPEFEATVESPFPRFNDLRFGGAEQGWGVGNLGLVAHNIGESTWERIDFPDTWELHQTAFPLCSRGILVGAKDPVVGPPVLIDQTDSIFSASETTDTGLIYHDLRSLDFSSTESGWALGGFGASMKYAAPTNAFTIATAILPDGAIDTAYSQQLSTLNGTGPETWSVCAGILPAGLDLSGSGLLGGTPTEAGEYRFQVSVADDSGQEAARWLTFSSQPEIRPSIVTESLPDGSVGTPYAAMLAAMGSVEPYGWVVLEGSLPPGMNMLVCGLIGGVPTTPGVYPFRVLVLDAQNPAGKDEKDVSITVLGRFVDTEPGEPCMGNPLFCLAANWKRETQANPSDFDGDGDSDAHDVLEALRMRRSP